VWRLVADGSLDDLTFAITPSTRAVLSKGFLRRNQLFADATNDGIRAARCYQAVWDYRFSLAELATFLTTDEGEVQRLLDQWEGI
jgi:hypothetical protein